jgi:diguanylate cyclase (GGDEF)-like protein
MAKKQIGMKRWRFWFIAGLLLILAFISASEYLDLPHLLLNAPPTPLNVAELMMEGGLLLVLALVVWLRAGSMERDLNQTVEQLEKLATLDDLTGLPNRRQCLMRLDNEIQRARRFQRPVSVAIMDLDGFKAINDRLGHLAGDRVLVEFTGLVARHIRSQDFFGRLGGDEFLVIFIETQLNDAGIILERVREQWCLAYTPTVTPGVKPVTLSAGVTTPQPGDTSMTDCLRRSDQALYKAKANGRNRVELA